MTVTLHSSLCNLFVAKKLTILSLFSIPQEDIRYLCIGVLCSDEEVDISGMFSILK